MKINSIFHVLFFLVAVLMFSMPFVGLAQQNSIEVEAAIAAKDDANKDVNKPLWFGTGCLLSGFVFVPVVYSHLLPPIGLAGIHSYRPSPPAARLVGKPMEYVVLYTETYKKERGKLQAFWSTAGCVSSCVAITGCVAAGIFIGVIPLPPTSESD